MTYRGRFAPSPTGPLHFGSLVAAVGSYLQARQQQGEWLVRIEDLDPPRTVPGSAASILHTLDALGFEWQGPVLYQNQRHDAYQQALQQLIDLHLAYPCSCTRSELQTLAREQAGSAQDLDELRYPGLCRNGPLRTQGSHAWRFRVPATPVSFVDAVHGRQAVDLSASIGDFVIRRRDNWFAYQLAVVVDDAAQGITEVVRGTDLLSNTPRQIALQQALDLDTPGYLHLPLVTDASGQKLGKSTAATAVKIQQASQAVWQALHFLQQAPPAALQTASLPTLWQWAIEHWKPGALRPARHC